MNKHVFGLLCIWKKQKSHKFNFECVWLYWKRLSSSNFWLLVCGWPLWNFLVSGPVPLDWFFCWRKYYIETAGQKGSQGEGLLDQGKFLVSAHHHSCMTTAGSYFSFSFCFIFVCPFWYYSLFLKKSVSVLWWSVFIWPTIVHILKNFFSCRLGKWDRLCVIFHFE